MYPFIGMDARLVPHVLELVTKTKLRAGKEKHEPGSGTFDDVPSENLDGIYRLLRNCHLPDLFSFSSPESILRQRDAKIRQLEAEHAKLKRDNASLKQNNKELVMEREIQATAIS